MRVMECMNDENLLQQTNACSMLMLNGTFLLVNPRFYKDLTRRIAVIKIQTTYGRPLTERRIDYNWKFTSNGLDICLGVFIPGNVWSGFYLRFQHAIDKDEFFTAFNSCIDFTAMDLTERIDRNITYSLTDIDQPIATIQDENDQLPEIPIGEMQNLLRSNTPTPKLNYYIRPDPYKIGNYPCSTTACVPMTSFADYFEDEANEEKKPHWREHPDVKQAQPISRRVHCDPILSAELYDLTTPAQRIQRRGNVPQIQQPQQNVVQRDDDPLGQM